MLGMQIAVMCEGVTRHATCTTSTSVSLQTLTPVIPQHHRGEPVRLRPPFRFLRQSAESDLLHAFARALTDKCTRTRGLEGRGRAPLADPTARHAANSCVILA